MTYIISQIIGWIATFFRAGGMLAKDPNYVKLLVSTGNLGWCFVWNKLYKADLIKDIRFVEGLQYGEDEIFNIDVLAKHNEIVHDDRFIALKRYFDNKQSLSRIKDRNGLLAQNNALIAALNRHADNPEIAKNICMLIGDHWQSPTYLAKFGGGTL